jgi:hypothetical protein
MIKRMKEFVRQHAFLIALILIQTLVFRQWLFADSLFTFGDVGVYTDEMQSNLLAQALSVYVSDTGFGNINIASSSNPLLLLFGVFAFLGVSSLWSMKLIIFYPTVYGVVLSSYLLIRKLTGSPLGAFFGALIYAYSTYFLITLTGALYLSLAYALSPFILLCFIRVLEQPSLFRKVQLACVAALVGYIEFRVLYINVVLLGVYLLGHLFLWRRTIREWWHQISEFMLPGILFVFLNLFWLLPLVLAGSVSNNVLFNRGLFGDSYFDILNALALFHPWWTGEVPSIFDKQTAPYFFYVLPILALGTLFISRRKRIIPFLVLFVLGVLLTKQSAEPFQALYLWLYQAIPGFNAFRESSKFYLLSTLSLSVLVGYILAHFETVWQSKKMTRGIVVMLLSLFLIAQIRPVADQSLGTMFIPRTFPEEYRVLNDVLNKDDEYYRILWFPHTNRFGTSSSLHPSVSLLLNMETNFKEFIDPNLSKFVDALASPLSDGRFPTYLNQASIRYIVVPSNLRWDDVASPWKNPEHYTPLLDALPFWTRIENEYLTSRGIAVYENVSYRPHLFLTAEKPGYQMGSEVFEIDYQSVRPTEHRIAIRNLKEPRYLNFSENYHQDWQLQAEGISTSLHIFTPEQVLPQMLHTQNEFGLNSFYLDPAIIKKYFTYVEHQDGSIDFDVTLAFRPERYYLFGVVVSSVVFVLCTVYLVYGIVRRKKGFIKGRNL